MPIAPYGGTLVSRAVSEGELAGRLAGAGTMRTALGPADLVNLANLANGCYSPLTGFMTEAEYRSVLERSALPAGPAWTVPILLRVGTLSAAELAKARALALVGPDGEPIAALAVESVFAIDRESHCLAVFGTTSSAHPGVRDLGEGPTLCVGGAVHVAPSRLGSFRHLRTPAASRAFLAATGHATFTAFSTRNICHLGHEHLHAIALDLTDMLGINVITGAEIKGSFRPEVIFDTYEHLIENRYPAGRVFLNNLRLPPIYAGPREAFLQAIVLQNLGFTHFIVGRDHAGIGGFYEKYASQRIFRELAGLALRILAIAEPRYCTVCGMITTERSCRHAGDQVRALNGRDVRRFLLERRYSELDATLRTEMQRLLVQMFEDQVTLTGDGAAIGDSSPVFFD